MKNVQLELFSGESLRDLGIQRAIDHANNVHKDWSNEAFEFLLRYIKKNDEFMAEDVRNASQGVVQEPPSNRAWGGVIVRAMRMGLIYRKGYKNVENAKAHRTPATLWGVM